MAIEFLSEGALMKYSNKFVVAALVAFSWSASSHALVTYIDIFSVAGAATFNDAFANGLTPTQEGAPYVVSGTFPAGAESGGKLELNTAWGVASNNAIGQPREALIVSRNGLNLNASQNFTVTGIFDLTMGSGPLVTSYGIRERASNSNGTIGILSMDVYYSGSSTYIRLLDQDFVNHIITTIDSYLVPTGYDQVALSLFNQDVNHIYGKYALGNAGVFGDWTTFSNYGDTDGVGVPIVAQFYASSAIPEPATLALVGLGLVGLVGSRRRNLR